jgi:two-component system alkaline phosphatase synthesis response regulator PhoP
MAHILVVDDDPGVQRVIAMILRHEGHQVTALSDGGQVLAMSRETDFDLYVLDVTLPTVSGLDVAMRLREFTAAPILLVTARDTEGDVLTGLTIGADDYITKPFSPAILAARVRSALRRTSSGPAAAVTVPAGETLTCEGLVLDLAAWTGTLDGRRLNLTAREFKLLTFLLRHRNRVVTRDAMLDQIWGADFDGSDRVVDVGLSRLRRHLLDLPTCPITVQAVPGVGYKVVLKGDDTVQGPGRSHDRFDGMVAYGA